MTTSIARWISGLIMLLSLSGAYSAPEKLLLDNQHSYIQWRVGHLGYSIQAGKWYVNGFVLIDKDHPDQGHVNVTVKINDLITGLPELDKHLKGTMFLDEKTYPTATFVSNKVQVTGKNTAKVSGMLTLRGITRPVVLDVILNKVGKNPITDKMTDGFTASTTIKRSKFGIKGFLPQVDDEVKIEIGAEAFQDNPTDVKQVP